MKRYIKNVFSRKPENKRMKKDIPVRSNPKKHNKQNKICNLKLKLPSKKPTYQIKMKM